MMTDIFYSLYDSDDKLIISTISQDDLRTLSQIMELSTMVKIGCTKYKYLKTKYDKGTCIAITTNADYLKSRKTYQKYLSSLIESIPVIRELIKQATDELNASTHRLIHNLTSINAHNIQEIYSEFPQDLISGSGKKSINSISKIIESKPRQISSMILRLAKNNVAMKAEFSVFKRIYDRNVEVDMSYHKVHRVLMNILYTFFPDFTEKRVDVHVHDSKEMAYLDYETVHVALYHLLDNAAKYTKMNTDLDVNISLVEDKVLVSFSMLSIVIDDNELDLIYQEGYSGKSAKKLFKSGHGIGMARIKEMLILNSATFNIERKGNIISENINGFNLQHQNNIFTISFLARKPK